jgi:hypothetical protein
MNALNATISYIEGMTNKGKPIKVFQLQAPCPFETPLLCRMMMTKGVTPESMLTRTMLSKTWADSTTVEADCSPLLDVDLAALRSLSLRDGNAQDTVLETSLDSILIDTRREGERAMELANRALGDPVSRLGRFLLLRHFLLVGLLSDLRVVVAGVCSLILDGRLVLELLLVLAVFELLLVLTVLDEALWALTLFADVLVAPGNGQCVVVGPFDVDVFLVDAGELAVELVAFLGFLDIELGGERADALELAVDVAEGLAVVLVEEAEEGSELLREAWEERHCCWPCGESSSGGWFRDAVELLWDSSKCCAQWLHRCLVVLCSDDGLEKQSRGPFIPERPCSRSIVTFLEYGGSVY